MLHFDTGKPVHTSQKNFSFAFNWKITLFFLAFLPILIALGFWQLDRADEKRILLEKKQAVSQQLLQPLASIEQSEWQNFLPTSVRGQFQKQKHLLLDNQIVKGQAGYFVYSLLSSTQKPDVNILVNRGWMPAPADRSLVPEVKDLSGNVDIEGFLWRPLEPSFVLKENVSVQGNKQWPKVIQSVNFEYIEELLQQQIYPWTLVMTSESATSYIPASYKISVSPDKHLGYAVQWFCMALALVGLFIYSSIKRD